MAESQESEKGWSKLKGYASSLVSVCVLVTVSLKPVGNAPALNRKKFLVEGSRKMSWMHQWLRKNLKCEQDESVVRESLCVELGCIIRMLGDY